MGVCVHVCVHVLATHSRETTRIDILFERKHNKTHWNMVQEEQGVILKVNKQKRRVAEVLFSTFITAEGEVGPTRERVMWGFLTQVALMVFHQQCSRPTCLKRESA